MTNEPVNRGTGRVFPSPLGAPITNKTSRRSKSRNRSSVPSGRRKTGVFLGLDLAWKVDGNHSAVAVLAGDERAVELKTISDSLCSLIDIVSFIEDHSGPTTVLAVDASLVVTNTTGQRRCETLIGRAFGQYHASCHTTNLTKPYARTGERLITALTPHGFVHNFDINCAQHKRGRWLFETYPHPSMVRLFALDRIIAYKKGTVAEKRSGLLRLQNHLRQLSDVLPTASLSGLLDRDVATLRGQALKQHEDQLDAFFCAYLAWYCWRWGPKRNKAYGSMENGYIVVAETPE